MLLVYNIEMKRGYCLSMYRVKVLKGKRVKVKDKIDRV
jgi:hypothetical protein